MKSRPAVHDLRGLMVHKEQESQRYIGTWNHLVLFRQNKMTDTIKNAQKQSNT